MEIQYIPDALLYGIEGFTSGKKGEGYVDYSKKEHPTGFYDPKTRQNPVINTDKFIQDAKKAIAEGKKIPMDFGVDGMNMVARANMFELAKNSGKFSKEEQSIFTEFVASKDKSEDEILAEKHFAKDPEKLKTYKQLSKELDKYRKKIN